MTAQDKNEALIARIAMGDRRALRALYDATSAKLFGIALRILKDDELAEEVLEQVYLRVWSHADDFKVNEMSPMTWLITLTRNAAVARQRSLRTKGMDLEGVELAERLFESLPTVEPSSLAREEAQVFGRCLAQLPPDRAEMLRKAYFQGVTYAEIGQAADAKLSTVRAWMRRAVIQLRTCLSE